MEEDRLRGPVDIDAPATVEITDDATCRVRAATDVSIGSLPRLSVDGDDTRWQSDADLRIERELGVGGTAKILVARQRSLGRRVAVKQLRDDVAVGNAQLLREAVATGFLDHPNIVPVHALGVDDAGRPLIVMKFIEGTPWSRMLVPLFRDEPASEAEIERQLRIFIDVSNALAFAHSRGILHRDIKPSNVMLGTFGEVYVVDWGLAVSRAPLRGVPLVGSIAGIEGTPSYMAPEMARDPPGRIDERTDVYLLGATLHELVMGERLRQGEDIATLVAAARDAAAPQYPASVPDEIAAICRRALAPDPADRHEDAAALRDAVAVFMQHRGAHRLADQAAAALSEVRDEIGTGTADEIRVAAAEVRFAFRLALREWPAYERARQGLVEISRLIATHELDSGNPAAAAAALAESPDDDPELRTRVAAALDAEREREAERLALQRQAYEQDFMILSRSRLRVSLLIGGTVSVMIATLIVLRVLGLHRAGYPDAIAIITVLAILHEYGRRLMKRSGANEVNNRWSAMLTFSTPLLLVTLVFCWVAGFDFTAGMAVVLLVTACAYALVCYMFDRRALVSVGCAIVAAFGIVLFPEQRGLVFLLGVVTAYGWLVLIWRRDDATEGMIGR